MMNLIDRVKEIGKEQGLTSVKQIAIKAGIGENSIYRWNINKPSTETLGKVAKALNVTIEDLTGEQDQTPEFRAIQRKARNYSEEDQKKLLKLMKAAFDDDDEEGE